jgi:hypothetical protein
LTTYCPPNFPNATALQAAPSSMFLPSVRHL